MAVQVELHRSRQFNFPLPAWNSTPRSARWREGWAGSGYHPLLPHVAVDYLAAVSVFVHCSDGMQRCSAANKHQPEC
jgi:hypothetical protein